MNPEIMILGDTHGDTDWLCNIVAKAADMGIQKIMQVGDFGIWDHTEQGIRFLDTVNALCRQHGIKIYFVPGNHENWTHLEWWEKQNPRTRQGHVYVRSHILYVPKNSRWTWENKTFMGCGGAVSIDRNRRTPGVSFWPQEQYTRHDLMGVTQQADYLFTHDAPSCLPMGLKDDHDSTYHRQVMHDLGRIVQPSLWFHGHYHRYIEYTFRHQKGYTDVYALNMNGNFNAWGILNIVTGKFKSQGDRIHRG